MVVELLQQGFRCLPIERSVNREFCGFFINFVYLQQELMLFV
jgi:hypothetical protein